MDMDMKQRKERVMDTIPSVTERYFERRYFVPRGVAAVAGSDPVGDQCVLFHSNRICVLTMAPSHPILREQKRVESVDFSFQRMNNKVTGKWKKGGQKLTPESRVCSMTCSVGSRFCFVSSIRGTLIEINDHIIQEPDLLTDQPQSDGYIAIVLPHKNLTQSLKDSLLTPEEYLKVTTDSLETNDRDIETGNGDNSEAVSIQPNADSSSGSSL
jgi:glycine cleavage system H lipoate-binding protein